MERDKDGKAITQNQKVWGWRVEGGGGVMVEKLTINELYLPG